MGMMHTPPKPIELTSEEQALLDLVNSWDDSNEWAVAAAAMEKLFDSLLRRDAIPKTRLRLFADPDYAETGKSSPIQVFEKNGTTGRDVYRHPHFIFYLRYFIEGPSLPQQVATGLCQVLNEGAGTSGEVMNQYRRFARDCVRTLRLDRKKAATEFFRLGVEVDMSLDEARILREAALSAN